ncbi:protein SSUH2 homolog isoform X1 [Polyodon spathula]|uniref:protein SSUH2 homolog isoform X1 n=1 Tax=Polyodon spathula TaxID=7913 RepID=UPI001B7E4465|nr:protein SSUH2 homolog isoform X1 [Polyodon spathula]
MDNKDKGKGVLDPEAPEEGPSALPSGLLDTVSGYEGTPSDGVGEDKIYPPPSDRLPKPANDQNASVPHVRLPTVSEDTARAALLEYVGRKWNYRSKPAKELVFRDLTPFTTYRYRLETFTESRGTAWAFEPYTNQLVDGPQYGDPPPPWDVMVEVPPMYIDSCQKVRVPHTSFVKVCHRCHGKGHVQCSQCNGWGKTQCSFCFGSGHRSGESCTFCHGSGQSRCFHCSGRGTKTCDICKGHRNLMHFIQLIVTWKNQIYQHVPDRCPDFPVKLFEKVNGDKFFVDESALVYPIVGFPEKEICDASKRGNDEHMARFSGSMHILQQRQTIELIPLTQAFYEYKEQAYNYFVYGIENKVHAPKYPSSCSIL